MEFSRPNSRGPGSTSRNKEGDWRDVDRKPNTDFRQYNFQITWEISGNSTVFLDLKLFKGAGWLRSSLLDMAIFAKAINAYLYIPFKSSAFLVQCYRA